MPSPRNTKLNMSISASDPPSRTVGEDGYYYECIVCNTEGELLCCETCPNTYHLSCLRPPLKSAPKGDWHCASCLKAAAIKTPRRRRLIKKATSIKQDSAAGEHHPLDEDLFDDEEQASFQNDVNLNGDAKDSKTTTTGNGLKVYTRRSKNK